MYKFIFLRIRQRIQYFVETDLDKPVMNKKKEVVVDPTMEGIYEMLKESKKTEEEITVVKRSLPNRVSCLRISLIFDLDYSM
jgi:hypothetical protein